MEQLNAYLHSFNSTPKKDSTIDVTFVIHDFELSGNGQVITEAVCAENMNTLLNKPILAKYYEGEDGDDHLGDHEISLATNRDTGDWLMTTDTVAIGVCTKVYIDEVEGKKCLLADGVLWSDRYYNACSLLYEWHTKGIRTLSSCEYLYSNYEVKEGIQYVKSDIIYEGIAVLNSEQRGEAGIVAPAYESSHMLRFSLNQAICKDINMNTEANAKEKGDGTVEEVIQETVEVVEEKAVNEEVAVEPIIEVAETTEEVVEVEEPVVEETVAEAEEVAEVETIELSKYQELEERLAKIEAELAVEKEAKCQLSEEVVSLNATIADLGVYKEAHDKEQRVIALNEKRAFYQEKFEKFGAQELFESEEVQGLIERCLNADEEKEARLALSEMLIGAGVSFNAVTKPVEPKAVVELTTPMKDLVPKNKFKEIYGFDK